MHARVDVKGGIGGQPRHSLLKLLLLAHHLRPGRQYKKGWYRKGRQRYRLLEVLLLAHDLHQPRQARCRKARRSAVC